MGLLLPVIIRMLLPLRNRIRKSETRFIFPRKVLYHLRGENSKNQFLLGVKDTVGTIFIFEIFQSTQFLNFNNLNCC